VVLIAKEWETFAEVELEDVMTVVLKQGDCILRGEHSRFEVVEEDLLLTDTNQGKWTPERQPVLV
jgi:hypothetical protein